MNGYDELRVGIYGGTFAPIHNGHVAAAKAFMEQMRLDYLYIIPTCLPPHKQMDFVDNPMDRLAMCELAFKDTDGILISDLEICRGGKSYTYDTLRELWRPSARLFLLCGTDMILTLDKWYKGEEIFKLCYPVYIRRENDAIITSKIIAKLAEYREKYDAKIVRIQAETIELSSTEIRTRVANGESIEPFVPKAVAEYIYSHGLYAGREE